MKYKQGSIVAWVAITLAVLTFILAVIALVLAGRSEPQADLSSEIAEIARVQTSIQTELGEMKTVQKELQRDLQDINAASDVSTEAVRSLALSFSATMEALSGSFGVMAEQVKSLAGETVAESSTPPAPTANSQAATKQATTDQTTTNQAATRPAPTESSAFPDIDAALSNAQRIARCNAAVGLGGIRADTVDLDSNTNPSYKQVFESLEAHRDDLHIVFAGSEGEARNYWKQLDAAYETALLAMRAEGETTETRANRLASALETLSAGLAGAVPAANASAGSAAPSTQAETSAEAASAEAAESQTESSATPDAAAAPAEPVVMTASKGVGPITDLELDATIDEELAVLGQETFESLCTGCHKAQERYVGPAYGGVTLRRQPEWIMNMILNPDKMIDEDEVARDLFAQYMTPMANQGLEENQARAILEYFRAYDAAAAANESSQ